MKIFILILFISTHLYADPLSEINQAIDEVNNIQFTQKNVRPHVPAEVKLWEELSYHKYDLIDFNQSLNYLIFVKTTIRLARLRMS